MRFLHAHPGGLGTAKVQYGLSSLGWVVESVDVPSNKSVPCELVNGLFGSGVGP